jgi:hypothetical protein
LTLSLSHAVKRAKRRKSDAQPGGGYIDTASGTDPKDGKLKAWATYRVKPAGKASGDAATKAGA